MEFWIEVFGLIAVTVAIVVDANRQEAARETRRVARPIARSHAKRCPYCHGDFDVVNADEHTLRCACCDTLHHTVCWADESGCAVYGCGGTQGAEPPASLIPSGEHDVAVG